jgi:RES domain-containing protein
VATEIAYRISDWDTPLRVNPNRSPGRYNFAEAPATQYLGLHPLTPWAEYLRANDLRDTDRLAERRLRIWVAQLDLSCALRIGFDNANDFGLDPEDLVGDDHRPCQLLADRFRAELGAPSTIVVPSAALPGTEIAVIFGERVEIPYGWVPIDEGDIPVSVIAERSQPPPGLSSLVRYRGEEHKGLAAWRAGMPLGPLGSG